MTRTRNHENRAFNRAFHEQLTHLIPGIIIIGFNIYYKGNKLCYSPSTTRIDSSGLKRTRFSTMVAGILWHRVFRSSG